MANILSVLAKAEDADILRQVATFEVVTVKNIVGTEGMKAVDMAAGLVNSVGRLLGMKKRLVKDVQPRSIAEQIEEKIAERACDSRETLNEDFRKLLTARMGLASDASCELISKELTKRAAVYLGLDEAMTPAERADAVFESYTQRLEKTGATMKAPQAGDWESIRQQLEQRQKFDLWQYIRGISWIDGEIYSFLVLMARFLYGRNFAPCDADLPDCLKGSDEEARQEIAASYDSYQAREMELEEARTSVVETEKALRKALSNEEAAKEAFSQQEIYLSSVQTQVNNFEANLLNAEIELGVLEGQLVMAARAEKKSARTINNLKKAILNQRERIVNLKREHEENILTLEQAPEKERQMKHLIVQAKTESEKERTNLYEAEAILGAARDSRDAVRTRRLKRIRQCLEDWQKQEYNGIEYDFDEIFLIQLAMNSNELGWNVFKSMKQVLDSETPSDLGEVVSGESLRLPIKNEGIFLIYKVNVEGKMIFLRITDEATLTAIQRDREEETSNCLI